MAALVSVAGAGDAVPALMPLGGRVLLDRALDRLASAAVSRILVQADDTSDAAVARHLAGRSAPAEIELLPAGRPVAVAARALLETGRLDPAAPFFILDGDVAWFDGPAPALLRLAHGFGPDPADTHEAVLLLARSSGAAAGGDRPGLALDPLGSVRRPQGRELTPFVFAGVQLVSPRLFRAGGHDGTLDALWDRAIAANRLAGQVHDSDWFGIESHASLAQAEAAFADRLAGVRP